MPSTPAHPPVVMLVYNASGTLLGEAAYFVNKWLGRGSCSLCTVTHRGVRVRPQWAAARQTIDARVRALHRNELDPRLQAFIDGALPCVVAEAEGRLHWLLRPEEIDPFVGRPDAMANAIRTRLAALGPPTP